MPVRVMSGQNTLDSLPRIVYLVAYVFLKVFVGSHVQTHTAVLEPFRLDFIRSARHGRDDDVRKRETFLK